MPGNSCKINASHVTAVRDAVKRGDTDAEIGRVYGCSSKTVSRFRQKYNISKHTEIDDETLAAEVNKLQLDEKQTHGRGFINSNLRKKHSYDRLYVISAMSASFICLLYSYRTST